jgi:hypothetical protein
MISTYLQGGLGNYMFQIAAAQALAWDLGVDAVFDFNLASQVHRNVRVYQDNILRNVKDVSNPKLATRYDEPSFSYAPLLKRDNQLLIGYFQSEKYFKHHRDNILELFSLPHETTHDLLVKYKGVLNLDTISCSIHVRRGDYLKLPDHHPTLNMQYYNEAMDMVGADKYLIFSDDIEWCKQNFIGNQFMFVTGELDYIDLYLMSLCYHNIIANSSFSWWGAWLNKYEGKRVVAPRKWFGPAHDNMIIKDVIPEKWIKIG